MKSLLDKPLKVFTWYALIILACSAPVYYYVVDYIWLDELDDHNQIARVRIENGINKLYLEEADLAKTLEVWNSIEPGTKLRQALPEEMKADSVYTVIRPGQYAEDNEIDRFRGLSAYFNINGRPYHLTIETNVEETDETFLAISVITLLFFGIMVIGFILLNRRIALKVWQPFRNTLDKLQSFDLAKEHTIHFQKSSIKEFEELNDVLIKLINRNVSVFKQQKQFTENASHELQTPLAVIKSKLDIFLQSKTLTEGNHKLIEQINTALARVSRINKNLLLLTKIENQQFPDEENIDLGKLLQESIKLLEGHFENKNLIIKGNIEQTIVLRANQSLGEILLTNILVNTIRYSEPGSQILIELTNRRLQVSNPGSIRLNEDFIFQRFTGASSHSTSSGLGLSIVKEICNLYGWSISYHFEENRHVFSVLFQ